MNRISPLLHKLSELYLSKVRNQYLQDGTLQEGDIDTVMRQTRSAYSELLEWQRTMAEIDAILLQENNGSGRDTTPQLPPPPPPRPVRAAAPPPPPPPAPEPEPVSNRAAFTPFQESEPDYTASLNGSYDTDEPETYFADSMDEEEEVAPPPPPPRPAPRPAPAPAAEAPIPPAPRAKATPAASGPASDIRELVSVNDKYLFVSELFNHNRTAYEKAMEAINKFRSRIQATNWVNALVKKEYKWEDDSPTAKAFYKVINQYFASR